MEVEKVHRTWVQLLIDHNYTEIAAIATDIELEVLYDEYQPYAIAMNVPTAMFGTVKNDEHIRKIMKRALLSISDGRLWDRDGCPVQDIKIVYRVKLIEVEDDWQNIVRDLIANSKKANQGIITEKMFSKRRAEPYLYNEIKFASHSEIRIAQEFEKRKVLFFPLPLAVRSDTGNFYKDHREVDFLVCENGTWGILEVSYHPDRFEKDAEKDSWFKLSGILCVQHYSAEKCYSDTAKVVDDFLSVLKKHKR
jgi:hypothetical protein